MDQFAAIFRTLLDGLSIRGRWLVVVSLLACLGALVFALESWTGWNYYTNLERKARLLTTLQALHNEGIADNPELYPVYLQAIQELSARPITPARLPSISLATSPWAWKAIGGGSLWLLLVIPALFGAFGKENKVLGSLVLLFVAIALGTIGAIIPTVYSQWVNCIAFPVLQLLLILILSRRAAKRKRSTPASQY